MKNSKKEKGPKETLAVSQEKLVGALLKFYGDKYNTPPLLGEESPCINSASHDLSALQETSPAQHSSPIKAGDVFSPLETHYEDKDGKWKTHFKPANRVHIAGVAGIGKSTLCQYLAYQWAQGKLKSGDSDFELLIWIPLGALAHYIEKTDPLKTSPSSVISGFLCQHESLGEHLNALQLDVTTIQTILEPFESSILYILDGYDDMGNLSEKSASQKILRKLLLGQNWLISSQPHSLKDLKADRKLEVIGLLDEDIFKYSEAYFNQKNKLASRQQEEEGHNKAKQFERHLRQNPIIWKVARVPAQLKLLFLLWEEAEAAQTIERSNFRVTLLCDMLDKQQLCRYLNDPAGGAQYYNRSQSLGPYQPVEINALLLDGFVALNESLSLAAAMALKGFAMQQWMMPYCFIEPLLRYVENRTEHIDELLAMGLLEQVGKDNEIEQKKYCFSTPLFQQYYAALYIVEALLGKTSIHCLEEEKLSDEAEVSACVQIEDFIQAHKYDARYETLWCLVVGRLAIHGTAQAQKFFDLLAYSREGPSSIRQTSLMISLLGECTHAGGNFGLPEIQYQEHLKSLSYHLVQIIKQTSLKRSNSISLGKKQLSELMHRLTLSPNLLQELARLIVDKDHGVTVISLFQLLGEHGVKLSAPVIELVLLGFQHKKMLIRYEVAVILQKQALLAEWVLEAIVQILANEKDELIRCRLITLLERPAALSTEMLDILAGYLEDKSRYLRAAVASLFIKYTHLSPRILEMLLLKLNDENKSVKSAAACALNTQKELPQKILEKLVPYLKDDNSLIRYVAASSISKQYPLSESVLNALMGCLQNNYFHVRYTVVDHLLGWQWTRAQTELMQLVSHPLVKKEVWDPKECTFYFLHEETKNPAQALEPVYSRLFALNILIFSLEHSLSLPDSAKKTLQKIVEQKPVASAPIAQSLSQSSILWSSNHTAAPLPVGLKSPEKIFKNPAKKL